MIKKRFTVLGLVSGLVLCLMMFVTGCGDLSKTVIIKNQVVIDSHGNITEYYSEINMPQNTYQQMEKLAQSEGYSSVREFFLRDFGGSNKYFGYNEYEEKGKTIIFKNLIDIDSAHTIKSITLNFENNELSFNDSTFAASYFIPKSYIKSLDYSVISPAKIGQNNANQISRDGLKATWTKKEGEDIPVLYIMSRVPVQQTLIPGFETVLAIIVIGGAFLLASKKK